MLTWSEELGKRIRTGDPADQAVSTVTKIAQSIDAGQWEPAAQLVDYFMEEAKVVFVIYTSWSEGFEDYLRFKEVPREDAEGEQARLRARLALDPERQWLELAAAAGLLANRLRAFLIQADEAHAKLDELRDGWRRLHDAYADYQAGLLAFVAHRFGEAALGECYRYVLEPYLRERYGPFDVRLRPYDETVFRNAYLSYEAMRGHLCGPERRGELEVEEDEDKLVIAFDPCGSGGRQQREQDIGVTRERHDWAWNEAGVCYYCAHCCFALELWPAEQWGHPVRVVDSPLYDEAHADVPKKCTWTIYKRLEAIPPEAYERIGRRKPE